MSGERSLQDFGRFALIQSEGEAIEVSPKIGFNATASLRILVTAWDFAGGVKLINIISFM